MLCHLTRWLISRTADTGKKMPPWAGRHAERCEACRAFASFSRALPSRLSGEVPAFLAGIPDVRLFRTPPESIEPAAPRPSRFRSFLRPLPIAALVLALAGGVFLLRGLRSGADLTPEKARAAMAGLRRVTAIPDDWPVVLTAAESSLEQERLLLENSARSAYAFLQDRLNITVERKDSRST